MWTGAFRPIVMQHGSSSIAESRRGADGMESIAARRRIDVLWALLRDNRSWARHHRRSLKRLDNPNEISSARVLRGRRPRPAWGTSLVLTAASAGHARAQLTVVASVVAGHHHSLESLFAVREGRPQS